MKFFYRLSSVCCLACIIGIIFAGFSMAEEIQFSDPKAWLPKPGDLAKHKKMFDDPSPVLKTFGPQKVLPKEIYDHFVYDVEEMKNLWSDLIGFKSPDIVGKLHPEITPGKYTYKDVQGSPAFQELMAPFIYDRIKPGGPPLAGCIPEFEIVPTSQYYYPLPFAEATKRNIGKTKQTTDGYIITTSWKGGLPFPKPSGPFKAQQVIYNFYARGDDFEQNMYAILNYVGIDKNLKVDVLGLNSVRKIRLAARSLGPVDTIPYLDKRSMNNEEKTVEIFEFHAPRDTNGMLRYQLTSLNPDKPDEAYMYIPAMRRIRKMTASDTQDSIGGADYCFDDLGGLQQKLTPKLFPYKYELVGEREYLFPIHSRDGTEFLTSDTSEYRNVKMERRPCYVVQMNQMDPHYIYSKRILYIDKETFIPFGYMNYDQKDRLYRSWWSARGWIPEMALFGGVGCYGMYTDHIDNHCTAMIMATFPVFYNRKDVSIFSAVKKGLK